MTSMKFLFNTVLEVLANRIRHESETNKWCKHWQRRNKTIILGDLYYYMPKKPKHYNRKQKLIREFSKMD